ncbi:CPBP family intramembrane glutamic endopeptidase [Actinomadura roseirufa]|uniref:CPBP family intramembrane glutamic endopeptidase n=1 Tax=Actinomadura roseirufa TaxID=2094049 RepID=UPI00104107BB|nr:CPBP family intramembrane glutamic endopeptidase [Actinomadura roseirufa]
MSEPGGVDGWAPLDPDLPTGSPADSPPDSPGAPAGRPPEPPAPPGPRAPAQGWSWPEQDPGPPPYQGVYGAPQRPPAPYGADPSWTGQYAPPQPGAPHYDGPPQPYQPYPVPFGEAGPGPVKAPWVVPTPPGTPFHRMARTAAHRWWRPLVGTLAVAGAGFALAIAMMILGLIVRIAVTGDLPDNAGPESDSLFGDDTADLAFELASLGVFLPVALLGAWGVQRRRPGTLSSVAGRLRWRWLLICCGLALAFCAVSYGSSLVAAAFVHDDSGGDDHWVGWGRFLAPALVIILLVPFQSAAEEYVFRGWLLQAVGSCTLETARGRVARAFSVVLRTPWPGIVLGSALFTAGHGYTGWGIVDIFFFGALSAWLAVRSGGLEAGIAMHVFNNLMAFLAPAAVGKLDIEQGGVPWQYVVADIIPMALYAAAVLWFVRRKRIQTVTPAAPVDDPGPDAPVGTPEAGASGTPVPPVKGQAAGPELVS